ncbi:hypothetical protein HPP92_006017 [Vanilla planifolia]|uniref:Dynein light chain n=1 Tax=Vanilla planifolia TaxID=51239 RepID=A0A835VF96_VANPL|nr:hypothetical protein HPP92_006017 [Vanilla planifolia]
MGTKGSQRLAVDGQRRRRSVSGTTIGAKQAAALLHVKVIAAEMAEFMQVHAFRSARRACAQQGDRFSTKQVASEIKKEFDKTYGPTWHCIVGTSFGSFVTHSRGCFLYFTMDNILIMLFMTRSHELLTS